MGAGAAFQIVDHDFDQSDGERGQPVELVERAVGNPSLPIGDGAANAEVGSLAVLPPAHSAPRGLPFRARGRADRRRTRRRVDHRPGRVGTGRSARRRQLPRRPPTTPRGRPPRGWRGPAQADGDVVSPGKPASRRSLARDSLACWTAAAMVARQHALSFLPLPQGQGALRSTLIALLVVSRQALPQPHELAQPPAPGAICSDERWHHNVHRADRKTLPYASLFNPTTETKRGGGNTGWNLALPRIRGCA